MVGPYNSLPTGYWVPLTTFGPVTFPPQLYTHWPNLKNQSVTPLKKWITFIEPMTFSLKMYTNRTKINIFPCWLYIKVPYRVGVCLVGGILVEMFYMEGIERRPGPCCWGAPGGRWGTLPALRRAQTPVQQRGKPSKETESVA